MTHAATPGPSAQGCNPRERTPDGLRHWRDARALLACSIREFAEMTGINRGQLSKIENGAAPTPDEARRILFVVDSFGPKR